MWDYLSTLILVDKILGGESASQAVLETLDERIEIYKEQKANENLCEQD